MASIAPVASMAPSDSLSDMEDPGPTISEPGTLRLATAEESGVEDQNVPNTVSSIKSFGFLKSNPSRKPPKQVVAMCTVEMSRYQRPISAEEHQAIFNILKSFNSLGTFSREMNDSLNIRGILLNILGETRFSVAPCDYPEPLQRNASNILHRLEVDIEAKQEMESSRSPPALEATRAPKRGRESRSQTSASGLSRLSVEDLDLKHIMRGILISDKSRRTYELDRNYQPGRRDCRVVGHNGLEVGDWWPLRICALRDGAHGAMQAGIAGSSNDGAYSIVISNDYAELDRDLGDILYYSGSNSHSNKDPKKPHVSYATKAMRVSCSHQYPVRVIRSSTADSKSAPSKGLRYDGLYKIESEAVERNKQGGAYIRFKLVRCPGQKDIDVGRPTRKEREIFDALKERLS